MTHWALSRRWASQIKFFQYQLDMLWESWPSLYIALLSGLVMGLVVMGAVAFYILVRTPPNLCPVPQTDLGHFGVRRKRTYRVSNCSLSGS